MPVKEDISVGAECAFRGTESKATLAAIPRVQKPRTGTTEANRPAFGFGAAMSTYRGIIERENHCLQRCSGARTFRIAILLAGLFACFAPAHLNAEPVDPGSKSKQEVPAQSLPGSKWKSLESFESDHSWSLQRPKWSDHSSSLESSGLSNGPYSGSGLYVSLAFRGRRSTPAILEPKSPVVLGDYAQRLSLWVYGWDQPVELRLILKDRQGLIHRVKGASLQFSGWKRLDLELPWQLNRRPESPMQDWYLELVGLELRPVYDEQLNVRLSVDELELLSAPAMQLPDSLREEGRPNDSNGKPDDTSARP